MEKTVFFLSGLPRSGSTLLANLLCQHPEFLVTGTSGISTMLAHVRNSWDRNEAFLAMDRDESDRRKLAVLRYMLQGYFAHADRRYCIDKCRFWPELLEMACRLVDGREHLKVVITVRDLRDVLASYECLYRNASALGQLRVESGNEVQFRTALGRIEAYMDATQPIGRSVNAIRDAVTRGWEDCMHFIEYEELVSAPEQVLDGLYAFLGVDSIDHDFRHVQQVIRENDIVHGFADLHTIRPDIRPQPPKWPRVYDQTVQASRLWKRVERAACFWRNSGQRVVETGNVSVLGKLQ